MNLLFLEATHEYFLDGERLPSVSEIKEPLTDFSMVSREVLERASRFGSAVHSMVELYLSDQLDYGTLDEGLYGPLEAFEKFLAEVKPFQIETGVLIDVKSRKFDRDADPVQLAAYHQLWLESGIREPIIERPLVSVKYRYAGTPDIIIPPKTGDIILDHRILFLGQDGKYKYTPAYDRNAWPIFGRLLNDYHRRIETALMLEAWRNRI